MDQGFSNLNQREPLGTAPGGSFGGEAAPKGGKGPLVAIIIIILLLIIGGIYMLGRRAVAPEPELSPQEIVGAEDATLNALETQSQSDEISAMESDLNATNLGDIDSELGDIEKELGL